MPERYSYITVDVFTDRAFAGNPLAVVTDASGLTPEQMQAIAAEFNYSASGPRSCSRSWPSGAEGRSGQRSSSRRAPVGCRSI